MCCIFRQYVVQNDLCVYLSWLLLSLIQCCAISYNVNTTRVRLMIMVVTTKYGRNSGSLKNKTHFLNWSPGSGASGSIVLVTRSHFVCWHTHMFTHSHNKSVKSSSLNLLSLTVQREFPHWGPVLPLICVRVGPGGQTHKSSRVGSSAALQQKGTNPPFCWIWPLQEINKQLNS